MGKFSDAVSSGQQPKTLYESVCLVLKNLNDGSFEEMCEALHSSSVTSNDIIRAVYSTTGIRISETTVRRWRENLYGDI